MKKATGNCKKGRLAAVAALVWVAVSSGAVAVPRPGEAIVAARVGQVQARVFTGPVHDGQTDVVGLAEGSSLGETARVMTGRDSWACIVLSPGAILCVAPETQFTFRQLRHASAGLPRSESDLIRRIHIELHRGRILVHAGTPTALMDVKVMTEVGEVAASGGIFIVAQTGKGEWAVVSEEYEQTVTPSKGSPVVVSAGSAVSLELEEDGSVRIEGKEDLLKSPVREFQICQCYFDDLESFIRDPEHFDRAGLGQYINSTEGIVSVVSTPSVVDVSPSVPGIIRIARPPATGRRPSGRRQWAPHDAWRWFDQVGVIKGVNYIPRYAVNSTEMWMKDTFDEDVIKEELDWAQDAGYTSIRVQLQYVVWENDREGFLDRMDRLLEIAKDNKLRVVPVLFDDMNLAGSEPEYGPQPDPVEGRHNARWTPVPGAERVLDRTAWAGLEEYVKEVIGEFRKDDRILFWDLYNRAGDADLGEQALPLMDQTFNWAREVDPKQPLAVAAWDRFGSAMSARMLERSDIITFQSFESPAQVAELILLLRRYERPVVCSDWLMRQRGNTFEELLPLFSIHRVGWFNRGLVQGRTQQWLQQDVFRSETVADDVWQHDVLKPNGTPYNEEELRLIREFRYENRF